MKFLGLRVCEHDSNFSYFDGEDVHYFKYERRTRKKHDAFENFESWVEYSKKIEETGVDGIEINFYSVPSDFEIMGKAIVHEKLDILETVKNAVKIPVAVKLSPYYTNALFVINYTLIV